MAQVHNIYVYPLSIGTDKTTKFPTDINEINGKNIVGLAVQIPTVTGGKSAAAVDLLSAAKLDNTYITLSAKNGKRIRKAFAKLFDTNGKNYPYLELSDFGALEFTECELTVGDYASGDTGKVVNIAFFYE